MKWFGALAEAGVQLYALERRFPPLLAPQPEREGRAINSAAMTLVVASSVVQHGFAARTFRAAQTETAAARRRNSTL